MPAESSFPATSESVAAAPARRRWGRRRELPVHRARTRISAVVYGNVLALAAVLALDAHDVVDGAAMLIVLVTAATTLCAHLLADTVGALVGRRPGEPWHHVRQELRDAVPIATSAILPTVCLVGGVLEVYPPGVAQTIAVAVVLLRLALMGLVGRHLFPEGSRAAALWLGVGVAGVGLLIAVAKLLLTH
ncbi:MAG: hypothetical protein QM604_04240 [Microbacterium sp.]